MLVASRSLAYWTGEAGDAARAQMVPAPPLLPVREQVLDSEHPDTLTTCASLAYWTGEAGDDGKGRGISSLRCYLSASGCLVPSTRTPWPPGTVWLFGLGECLAPLEPGQR